VTAEKTIAAQPPKPAARQRTPNEIPKAPTAIASGTARRTPLR
jgi:hypothetical protein